MSCVLFLHFHKAGGTTINDLFNGYKKFPINKNGNPYLDKDTIIHFWNFNKHQFNLFKKMVSEIGVKFIAMEWNFFKHDVDLSGFKLITCLRDPYDRFISNLNFDGRTDAFEYQKENIICNDFENINYKFYHNYNKNNYYVKLLNGYGDRPDIIIDEKHLVKAMMILKKFNDIIILEKPKTWNKLKKYGIIYKKQDKKNQAINEKIDGGMTKEKFRELNEFDYRLYDYACMLSTSKKN